MSRLTEALSDVGPGDRLTVRAVDGRRITGDVTRVDHDGGPVVELGSSDETYRLAARVEIGIPPNVDRLEEGEWARYGELVAIEAIERESGSDRED